MMETDIDELQRQISELEGKLIEAQETIDAIRMDRIDALVVSTMDGDKIYTLEGAERPYRIFLEQMNEGAITLSNDGTILFCNKGFSEMIDVPINHILGSYVWNWVAESDEDFLHAFVENKNDNIKEEVRFVRSDGTGIFLYLSKRILNIDNTEPVLCIVITDLSEKKKNEEIVAAEKLARSILEQAGEAIVVCDDNLKIIRHSKAAEKLAGTVILNKFFDNVFNLINAEGERIPLGNFLENFYGKPVETILENDSEKLNLMLNIGTLSGFQNNIIGYVINLINITSHIEAEQKLAQSLKEKTVLLKEIHHRVKNNLQIISSLLRLQSLYVSEEHLLSILHECQNRISSMALIHQKLYESKSIATININEYLRELVIYLCSTYTIHSENVRFEFPEKNIPFSIDSAVPLGLILNELVSNSFKHAFRGNSHGVLIIKIEVDDDGLVLISIKDNGIGIPDEIDFFNPTSLGLQLVHSLIEQISGEIKLIRKNGTEIIISIPPVELI